MVIITEKVTSDEAVSQTGLAAVLFIVIMEVHVSDAKPAGGGFDRNTHCGAFRRLGRFCSALHCLYDSSHWNALMA